MALRVSGWGTWEGGAERRRRRRKKREKRGEIKEIRPTMLN